MRTEQIKVTLICDAKAVSRHKKRIAPLVPHTLVSGSTVQIDYCFNAEYLGRTAENMAAIARLARAKGVVCNAQINELKHGKSLLVEMIRCIDELAALAKAGAA